jgi:ubiquinone/menaquinone biosynthesis C-methylase UbiE
MPEAPEKRTSGTSLALIRTLSRLCSREDHILEVGCGRGYTCLNLAPKVGSIIGLDISQLALKEATALIEQNKIENVTFKFGLADELLSSFGEEVFDKVISIAVLEHLHPEDAQKHLIEVHSVLKPGGKYIIVTPNRLTGPHDITRTLYPKSKTPLGFHLNELSGKELRENLIASGFNRVQSVLPLSFKLPIPLDLVFPSSLFVGLENLYIYYKSIHPMISNSRILGRIFIIATKPRVKQKYEYSNVSS